MSWLLTISALVGLLIAIYFSGVTYGWLRPDAALVPSFCRMQDETCQAVVGTPEASVFGLPNSIYGLAYYVAVLGWLASRPWPAFFESALLAAALWTVLLGAYLAHALRFRLHVPCPLCFTAHAINLLLAIALTTMMPSP